MAQKPTEETGLAKFFHEVVFQVVPIVAIGLQASCSKIIDRSFKSDSAHCTSNHETYLHILVALAVFFVALVFEIFLFNSKNCGRMKVKAQRDKIFGKCHYFFYFSWFILIVLIWQLCILDQPSTCMFQTFRGTCLSDKELEVLNLKPGSAEALANKSICLDWNAFETARLIAAVVLGTVFSTIVTVCYGPGKGKNPQSYSSYSDGYPPNSWGTPSSSAPRRTPARPPSYDERFDESPRREEGPDRDIETSADATPLIHLQTDD
jgi:hypothetical protein